MSVATATRPLVATDLERVVGIDGQTTGRSRRAFFAKRFGVMAEDRDGTVAIAAESSDRVVGFLFAHVLDGEFGGTAPVGVLDAIAVAPAARGGGVARALLAALERDLEARGARELRTQVEWTEHDLAAFFAAAGFRLSPRLVLERAMDRRIDDEFAWENLPVRSMSEADLPAIIRLDRKVTGRDRSAYCRRKAAEALRQSGVRVSLVAEVEGQFAGFLMARVDYGDFGRTEPTAALDTIGVDPSLARRRVGRALLEQLLLNLGSLRVERLLTEVEWNQFDLLAFLARSGFEHSQRLSFVKDIGPARESTRS
jgi:ribosomal protein S18 acetylase RimI-like enzyme